MASRFGDGPGRARRVASPGRCRVLGSLTARRETDQTVASTGSDTAGEDVLLDDCTAIEYLRARGVVEGGEPLEVRALGGGVSNVVLAVKGRQRRLILKQSLPRLRVADEWLAPRERVLSEAAALDLTGRLVPGSVPRVLDRDPTRHAIVLEHAPDGWRDWKGMLLAGAIHTDRARRVGELAGRWHRATSGGRELPATLAGDEALEGFEALRLAPYYRTTAERAPELADKLLGFAEQLRQRRICLVHGDLSPKNVLVPEQPGSPSEALWVIDFEVAHYGDPTFDVAFLLNHLLLKSLHRPVDRSGYDVCAEAFLAAYLEHLGGAWSYDWRYVFGQLGCLLLARVRGKSPAEYLEAGQRDAAWRLGCSLLDDTPEDFHEVMQRRDQVLA